MPDIPFSASGTPPVETEIWRGHTSQWVHFWYYFFCVILAAAALAGIPYSEGYSAIGLALPILMWLMRWWLTRSTTYELTSQRLKIHRGILTRRLEEVELYRVKDYVMEQPLFLRMVGRGNLLIVTSDATTRNVLLSAIPQVAVVREQLRGAVQSERDRKRVRELDIDNVEPSV